MSDPVIISIVVAASTCIQALIATLNHADTTKNTKRVEEKVEETHLALNGRLQELVDASKAQGRMDQQSDDRRERQ